MKTSVSLRAPRLVALLALAFASLSVSTLSAQTTVSTIPVGATTYAISGGSVATPVTTTFSINLADSAVITGAAKGKIASLTSTTITCTGAGWAPAALSTVASPYVLRITSGVAVGQYFGIDTATPNTADTVTLTGADLTTLSILTGSVGDTFEIVPVDTLATLFGATASEVAATGILGGASAAAADNIVLGSNLKLIYYYNTANGRWQRTTGSTTSRNTTPVPLNSLISISRKDVAFNLTLVGNVPYVKHTHVVANAGATYTNTGFPTDVTIGDFALQNRIQGWVSSASATTADTMGVSSGATTLTYFHNGTNWQRTTGSASNRDLIVIPAGAVITITKKGSAPGTTLLARPLPYTL